MLQARLARGDQMPHVNLPHIGRLPTGVVTEAYREALREVQQGLAAVSRAE